MYLNLLNLNLAFIKKFRRCHRNTNGNLKTQYYISKWWKFQWFSVLNIAVVEFSSSTIMFIDNGWLIVEVGYRSRSIKYRFQMYDFFACMHFFQGVRKYTFFQKNGFIYVCVLQMRLPVNTYFHSITIV